METAFSCRENLEDKGIICQIIVLAHYFSSYHFYDPIKSLWEKHKKRILQKMHFLTDN